MDRRITRLFGTALVAIWLLVAVTPVRTIAPDVPSRLTDETFWDLVTDMSEPDGHFLSDNFASNESAYQHIIPDLGRRLPAGDVYIGVGPEQNFTYLVALRPSLAFIIDIRRQNLIEHLLYKALIELSANRVEFVSRLFSLEPVSGITTAASAEELFNAYGRSTRSRELYARTLDAVTERLVRRHRFDLSADDLKQLEYVFDAFYNNGPALRYSFPGAGALVLQLFPTYSELMTATDLDGAPRSYLSSEERFQVLKEFEESNRIIPLVGDFAGPKTIRSVGRYVKENGGMVGAFYTSNVEQYLFQQDDAWRRFYDNLTALPIEPASVVVRSVSSSGFQVSGPSRLATPRLSPIAELLQAYNEGRIAGYSDVIAMSK
jgi:hypothetical protein